MNNLFRAASGLAPTLPSLASYGPRTCTKKCRSDLVAWKRARNLLGIIGIELIGESDKKSSADLPT